MRVAATLAALAMLTVPAAGAVELSLTPDRDADSKPGYRPATLTVRNTEDASITAVHIRPAAGGPGRVVPAAVAPGGQQAVSLQLPALSQQQDYQVRPIAGDAVQPPQTVPVRWPVEWVDRGLFIDADLHQEYGYELPRWGGSTKRFALALLAMLSGGAVMVVFGWRRLGRALRGGLIVIWLVAAAWLPSVFAGVSGGALRVRRIPAGVSDTYALVVVASMRTTVFRGPSGLVPVYFNAREMRGDGTTTRADGRLRAPVSPGTVRLFRDVSRAEQE